VEKKAGRKDTRDSHTMKTNPKVATKETIDPKEETTFHAI